MNRLVAEIGFGLALVVASVSSAQAQLSTAITYQGRLDEAGQPKVGTVDLRFDAFDAASGGNALNAAPVIQDAVPLDKGVFTVQVDFGPGVFFGGPVFVEVGVREDALGDAANTTGFIALQPRQQATATPYALHAENVAANSIQGGDIINESITGSDVDDGSLRAVDANTTSVLTGLQRRVSGECQADRAAIRAINDDGSIRCIYVDTPATIAPIAADAVGDVGEHVSVATVFSNTFGAAYYDRTNSRLKFVSCAGVGCNAPIVIDDTANRDVGQFASVTLGSGSARIAYYDATGGDLKLAICNNSSCTGTITIRTLDTTGDVGRFAALIQNDFDSGNAAVAYYDATNNVYKLARCQDSACTTNQVTTLTGFPGGGVGGSAIAMTMGQGAAPRILLLESGSQAKLIRCVNTLCNFNNTAVTFSTAARAPLALVARRIPNSSDPIPLWVGFASTSGNLAFHQCDDDQCNVTRATAGTGMSAGLDTTLSLTLRPEQLPLAVGIDAASTVTALTFVERARRESPNPLSASGSARGFVAAVHNSSGEVGVFYHDANDDLIFQRCARSDCSDQ